MEIYFAEPTLDVFLRFTELTGIKLKVLISYCYERGNIEETVNAVSKFMLLYFFLSFGLAIVATLEKMFISRSNTHWFPAIIQTPPSLSV